MDSGVAAAVGLVCLVLLARLRSATKPPLIEPATVAVAAPFTTTYLKSAALPLPKAGKFKHAVVETAVPLEQLQQVFTTGVLPCYQEMQLPAYSRYESWTQSCYMEIDLRWTPRPEINQAMFEAMKDIQEHCRQVFAKWYAELYSLECVEVTTLNSFVTKYVPSEGKNEFGKHIDGVKVHGSLVLALPTDEPHDWPGILVWDGPKGRGPIGKDPRPEHHYVLQPGDALVMDRMVWHHGLPITKGNRYVVVNFYSVAWKFVKKEL
ncbi:hypothetical protein BASA81_013839 [Batrachochytrium salamandrivorans]|nr:hypothetical protein BASA81_013839 [Batrachochytrium salamandrivorans]